jgi:rSAM/selenodomain-associated transferase 2
MTTSVIIPVLNERQALPRLIDSLRRCDGVSQSVVSQSVVSQSVVSQSVISQSVISQSVISQSVISQSVISQIVVSDGGSSDGTQEWCRSQPDVVLINSPRGKGPQLNAGASAASGDLLFFLHADCVLGAESLAAMRATMEGQCFAGGAFHIRFIEREPRSLRLVAAGINLRTSVTRTATGDQGIFVRRDIFRKIGGAPDWPLFEDVELVRRIKTSGRFAVIPKPLMISGRRYIEHGVMRTALLIYLLRAGYWMGISPHRLKRWFADVRR